jgi:hypothetical protein
MHEIYIRVYSRNLGEICIEQISMKFILGFIVEIWGKYELNKSG